MKRIYFISALFLTLFGLNGTVNAQEETPEVITIASWDFSSSATGIANTTDYGPNVLAPTISSEHLIIGGMTRSEVLQEAVEGNALSINLWGARNFNTTNTTNEAILPVDDYEARIAETIEEGKYITFTVTPKGKNTVTITGIDEYKVRCNNQAVRMRWQYSVDGTTFKTLDLRTDNETMVDYSIGTNSGGITISGITFAEAENSTMTADDLAELEDIEGTITFRIIFYQPKATSKQAVAGFYDSILTIRGTVVVNEDETGVNNPVADNVKIRVEGQTICVQSTDAASISVYSVSGKLISTKAIENGNASIDVNNNGVYMVKVGNKVSKVIL